MADQTDLPQDIQEEYYEPERKERSGVAWLLAIGTLIVTVLLATGLFFAGRWTYRQIAGTDGNTSDTPSEVATNNEQAEEEQPDNNRQNQGGAGGGEESQDDDGQVAGDSDQNNQGGGTDEELNQTGDDPNQGDQPQQEQDDRQVAGTDTESERGDLPATGPADAAATFAAVTVMGYLLHRFYLSEYRR